MTRPWLQEGTGVLIRPATTADAAEIDALLDAAFGPGRYARTASRLRAGAVPLVGPSLVARGDDGVLLGSIQFWPVMLLADGTDAVVPLTLLGPVAVAASARSIGLGRRLIAASLTLADADGLDPILLIGDLSYYAPFGFDAAATGGWTLPGPVERERLLVRQRAIRALPRCGRVVAVDSVPAANGAIRAAYG